MHPPLGRSVKSLCAEITRTAFRREKPALIDIQPAPFSGNISIIFCYAYIGRVEATGEFYYPFLAVNFNVSLGAGTAARTAEAVNLVKSCVICIVV